MKIENPNGIIKIKFDGFLSCLIIKKPRTVDWPDHGGSVARYYACLPFNEFDGELQNEIERRVSSVKSIQEFEESGFLNLLETGEYEFELWEDIATSLIYNTNLLNSNETIHCWHKREIGMHRAAKPYSLNSFYPYGRQLMFTQPFETLNLKRIKHYEDIIKKGERPLAISIRVKRANQDDEESYQDTGYNTTKYILDGHHKLVAYHNLKIDPSYIVINRIKRDEYDESSLPNLKEYLFYYQIENIVTNGLESMRLNPRLTNFIDEFIKNAPRIEDTLVRTLYNSANLNGYENNEVKRNWFKDRLNILIERVDSANSEFHLGYYCSKNYRRKYIRVNKWSEIKEIMKEQL